MTAVHKSTGLADSIAGALAGRTRFSREQVDQYRRIQAAVPPSTRFFCFLDWPLLFDLTRNDIFYPDNIGEVSPLPGMPLSGQPEEFADYLRSAGVRYVACPTPEKLGMDIRAVERDLPKYREMYPACRLYSNQSSKQATQ